MQPRKKWSRQEAAELLAMKAAKVRGCEIAAHFGVSERAVKMKYAHLRGLALRPPRPEPAPRQPIASAKPARPRLPWECNGERWNEPENADLVASGDRGEDFGATGQRLGRTRWACKVQYDSLKRNVARAGTKRGNREAMNRVAQQVRAAPVAVRTLTAELLGDPLPGRSALDQRCGVPL